MELFVFNKSQLNKNHEFGLVVLTDQANWVKLLIMLLSVLIITTFYQFCDFNNNPELVCEAISSLEAVEDSYQSFGMIVRDMCYHYLSGFIFVDTASLFSLVYVRLFN